VDINSSHVVPAPTTQEGVSVPLSCVCCSYHHLASLSLVNKAARATATYMLWSWWWKSTQASSHVPFLRLQQFYYFFHRQTSNFHLVTILGTSGAVMHLSQYFCMPSTVAHAFSSEKMVGHVTCVETINDYNTSILNHSSHVRFAVHRDVFYKTAFSWDVMLFVIYVKIQHRFCRTSSFHLPSLTVRRQDLPNFAEEDAKFLRKDGMLNCSLHRAASWRQKSSELVTWIRALEQQLYIAASHTITVPKHWLRQVSKTEPLLFSLPCRGRISNINSADGSSIWL